MTDQKSWIGVDRLAKICIVALSGLLSVQFYGSSDIALRFLSVEQSVVALDSKINELETLLKDLSNKLSSNSDYYQESSSNSRLLENGVYDIEGHSPHARYLKNIETLTDDPRIPADPDREYTYDDFLTIFEVEPLHQSEPISEVAEMLMDHDVTNDEYYDTWNQNIAELESKYSDLLRNGSLEQRDRDLMVVKWVSTYEGFGVFARRDIKEGELVGEYTGEIVKDPQNAG